MSIISTNLSLFELEVESLVNPINCIGVMGRGIALEFKKRYPKEYHIYREMCEGGKIEVGSVIQVKSSNGKGIVLFPTKEDWRNPSKIEWVEEGLKSLANLIINHNIASIALPLIGCGLGGLKEGDVIPLIDKYLGNLSCKVYLSHFKP
jgi:O-acetyl-ADP-ribose deacetylase (regulator of RNase III)